jgi:hypothetical protein
MPAAITAGQVVETAMDALKSDKFEIVVGTANDLIPRFRNNPDELFKIMNGS